MEDNIQYLDILRFEVKSLFSVEQCVRPEGALGSCQIDGKGGDKGGAATDGKVERAQDTTESDGEGSDKAVSATKVNMERAHEAKVGRVHMKYVQKRRSWCMEKRKQLVQALMMEKNLVKLATSMKVVQYEIDGKEKQGCEKLSSC